MKGCHAWWLLVFLGAALWAPPLQAQYAFHFGRNKIQYENFDWHVLKTDHFDVYFYPEMQELAEMGAAFAEEAYEELENKFNFSLIARTPIVFYSSNLHFKQTNITTGFIPDGVGGFFEFLKGRVVIPANGNLHRFRRVVRHEMVHVFTFNKAVRVLRDHRIPPDRFLPLWFTEGLAEYWSGEPDYQHEMIMRDAIFSNYLVPLESIYRVNGSFVMYKEGEALCRFLAETYGEERLLALIDNSWMDRDFRKVMEETMREEYQTISERWQEWLRATYYPMLDEAEAPTLVAGGLAVEGFNSKPVVYQFRDGRRQVYFVGNHDGYSNVFYVDVDSLYQPLGRPRVLIRGERGDRFEAFHLFESRLSVSRDGHLAFVTKSGETDVIHTYDLERQELGPAYGMNHLIAVYSPSWSPDGKQIAFTSIDQSGFIDLYTIDTETRDLRRLTRDSYDERDPDWSPDGRYIAFSSDRTSRGKENAYNLFTYDTTTGAIAYLTFGSHHDLSPRWSPEGDKIVFTSARRDSTGKFGGQDMYVVDATTPQPVVALSSDTGDLPYTYEGKRRLRRLTNLTTAAFDPYWTRDGHLLFASFENLRFTIRQLQDVDSFLDAPKEDRDVILTSFADEKWAFESIAADTQKGRIRYKRRYGLDIAQGQISNNAVWGTTGGAALAFSDLLGNDRLFVTVFNASQYGGDFFRSLNVAISRVQLHRRTNIGYGIFRYGGLRYDITDPDAASEYPRFWEEIYGGFVGMSYPLSMFRRIEINTSLSWDHKQIPERDIDRQAFLLSNAVSLVHDNALYGLNGPIDGWRAKLTAAYTTDVRYSNVNYVTFAADIRHYLRIGRHLTFASRAMARANAGREARLWFIGGSWDLRGFPLFDVRGKKMWFTSHEFRFPIVARPSVYLPILAILGITNLRGALFFDAAHAWNDSYYQRIPQIFAGETLGSTGLGLRLNLFGGFVLRYDVGYRFREDFTRRDRRLFRQFFFGFDF